MCEESKNPCENGEEEKKCFFCGGKVTPQQWFIIFCVCMAVLFLINLSTCSRQDQLDRKMSKLHSMENSAIQKIGNIEGQREAIARIEQEGMKIKCPVSVTPVQKSQPPQFGVVENQAAKWQAELLGIKLKHLSAQVDALARRVQSIDVPPPPPYWHNPTVFPMPRHHDDFHGGFYKGSGRDLDNADMKRFEKRVKKLAKSVSGLEKRMAGIEAAQAANPEVPQEFIIRMYQEDEPASQANSPEADAAQQPTPQPGVQQAN